MEGAEGSRKVLFSRAQGNRRAVLLSALAARGLVVNLGVIWPGSPRRVTRNGGSRLTGLRIAIALFALLNCLMPVFAWGPVAHRAIAKIAESRLTPQARRAVLAVLGKDGKNHAVHLDQIAACPDAFSMGNERFCAYDFNIEGDPQRSKPWHYINIPISLKAATADSLKRYCPHGENCVVGQIRKDISVLKNPKSSRLAQQEALMYLVHFVGDAHQPLHCADDHDQGGNLKPVERPIQRAAPEFTCGMGRCAR